MRFHLLHSDITKLLVDAIVNAANSRLKAGGGVDGAIHKAGGNSIQIECNKIINEIGSLPAGEAVATSAGNLKAKFIIHTVGPFWQGGNRNEKEKLMNCYSNSFRIAEQIGVNSIAFPNISTGVYGFPKQIAAKIVLKFTQNIMPIKSSINDVYFVCFDDENFTIYKEEFLASGINCLIN